MRTRRSPRRAAWLAGSLALLVAVLGVAADGTLADLVAHARAARYAEAREVLGQLASSTPEAPRLRLWGQRLAADPERALELATSQVRDRQLDLGQRIAAAVDGAAVAYAAGDLDGAWALLQPLLDVAPQQLPGDYHVLAGLVLNRGGQRQRAREMLASVGPDDPAFLTARTLLGRIGLEAGDNELALRYFESAARHTQREHPELLAGRWQALRLLGRDVEAREIYRRLLDDHPASLAALEVREIHRREAEDVAAVADTADVAAPEVLEGERPGLYAVQLAAFRDRALALQFVQRWQVEVPDLRIERGSDELGQPLYRVHTGRFVSHALARTEAARLQRAQGLDGFVTGTNSR